MQEYSAEKSTNNRLDHTQELAKGTMVAVGAQDDQVFQISYMFKE